MEKMKNLELQLEIKKACGTQSALAKMMGVQDTRLSRIIHRWETPTAKQMKIFEKLLGKERARELLGINS